MARVHLHIEAGCAVISFDNPPTGLLTAAMVGEFETALEGALASQDVRVLVLTGTVPGVMIRHFDLADLAQAANALAETPVQPPARWDDSVFHRLTRRLETCAVPVIAAINGDCMGVGFEIALACDIRIAQAGDFSLGLPEMNLAMFPGGGGTVRLARALGVARALEWIATARVVSPDEALAHGLVSEVVADPLARAWEMAGAMAARSPGAIAATKRLVHAAQGSDLEAALSLEQQAVNERLGSAQVRRRLEAYLRSDADLRDFIAD